MPADEVWQVGPDTAGERLDRVLAGRPSIGSRAKARTALETGKVSVDGEPVGPEDGGRALAAGAEIRVSWNRPGTSVRRAEGRERLRDAGVKVIFEDADLLALDKPAGLLTDAASVDQVRAEDTLAKRARAWVGHGDVHAVHRIDRDTTGVVLFAKNERAHASLKAQWGARTPLRQYVAVVEGRMEADAGRFADWMRWDGRALRQRACRANAEDGVLAEADWVVRERLAGATVLEVRLVSGRRNQIRLHAELVGHPLVGERLYRSRRAEIPFERQALHAERLVVAHPDTRDPVELRAALPPDLAGLLARLRRGRRPG